MAARSGPQKNKQEALHGALDDDTGSDLDVSQNWSSSSNSASEDDVASHFDESDDEYQQAPCNHRRRPRGIRERGGYRRAGRQREGKGSPPSGWTDTLPQLNIPQYTQTPGPKCNLPYDASELEFLLCLIGEDFFKMLAKHTNMNAACKSPAGPPYPAHKYATSDKRWSPTNDDEIKAFVAINILMGIKQTPEYTDYWSEDQLLNDPYISTLLTRNRYEKLSQYFYCSDPNKPAESDHLNKVRNVINGLQSNFKSKFIPGRCLSVDEAMIKSNGRFLWKQHMPKKPTKRGIKLWFLCDSLTGYCLNFEVYTGQRTNLNNIVQEFGLGYKVIMDLLQAFLWRYHHVYADEFFSSLALVEDLLNADTFFCGTLCKDRVEIPCEIQRVKLKRYESVKWTKESSSAMVTHWLDKEHIYLISTNNSGEDTWKPSTRFHHVDVITCPTVVTDYNAYMGGVDHSDRFHCYYNVGRTGRRWWKYLFWGLFNQAIVNAYILWGYATRPHSNNKRSHTLKAFKVALIHLLADGFSSRKRKFPCSSKRPVERVVDGETVPGHSLVQFGDRKRNCVNCSRAGRFTEGGNKIQTTYGCTGCRASMCKLHCFNDWHKLMPE